MLETTFQKLIKVENVQQADSSRKGILLRILGPTVFFTRRQTMKDERNAFSFSGIRIPYFPYLVSIPIETLFTHFSSLSPFPDNYNRRRLAFRRCHPSPCSLQRNKTRKEEKEGIRKGREIRSVTDNVTVPLSLFPYETTMRLPAVTAGFTAEPRVPGVPTVPHDSFLVRNVCARTYIGGEGYETARTKRLMRRYRKKIKTVVWLDKRLIFNGANLEESR